MSPVATATPHNTHHLPLMEGDVGAHLRRLALPMVWGLVAMSTFALVDTLYIARLGTEALAALGFTMPVVMLFLGIIWGMMVGTTSVLSRAHGAGTLAQVRRLATDAMVMSSIIVLAASLLGYLFIDHIFRAMGAPAPLMPMIHSFMAIWYSGMIFASLMLISNACIRADGNTRVPSILMISSSVINIVVDPFLIFGWGPFPALGFAGAAVTLVISYILTAAVALYYLGVRQNLLCAPLFHRGMLVSWGKLLHVGGPVVLSNLIVPVSSGVVTWIAARMGTEAVAAFGVSMRIEGMAILVFYAMGAGLSIFTGQNFGAGNYGRVRDVVNVAVRYALVWGGLMTVFLWAAADIIPLAFDKHPAVIRYTAEYLRIVPVSYAAMGMLIITNSAMNAMGKPLPAMGLILLRAFVIYVPLAFLGAKFYGFEGILYAMVATNILVGFASYLWNKIIIP